MTPRLNIPAIRWLLPRGAQTLTPLLFSYDHLSSDTSAETKACQKNRNGSTAKCQKREREIKFQRAAFPLFLFCLFPVSSVWNVWMFEGFFETLGRPELGLDSAATQSSVGRPGKTKSKASNPKLSPFPRF